MAEVSCDLVSGTFGMSTFIADWRRMFFTAALTFAAIGGAFERQPKEDVGRRALFPPLGRSL